MERTFNRKEQKSIRKFLRRQDIGAEKLLWQKLRNKNFGFKFRRQHGIGKYIVDFYCPKLKLTIEIDGATHANEKEIRADQEKDKYIKDVGVVVTHYLNKDVYENQDLVVDNIIEICNKLKKN